MAAQMEACTKRASILDKAAPDLSKLLAVDDDFLRELVARDVINDEQRETIENIQTNGKKVDKLLGIIKRTTGAFDGFMELLNCDKTTDLYNAMKTLEDSAGFHRHDMAALLETRTKIANILDKATPYLSKFLAIDNAFLRELVAKDVITDEEREAIKNIPINAEKVDKLLGIIKRTTGAYDGFMELLKNCDKRMDLYKRMKKLQDGLRKREQYLAPGTSSLNDTIPTKKSRLSTIEEKEESFNVEYWRKQLVDTYLSMPQNTMRLLPDLPDKYQDIEEGFVELGMTRKGKGMEGMKVETYEKLVDLKDSKGKQCKRVMVDGKPGMGKSTVIKRLAYQWAKTFTESPFELVFVLKMKEFEPRINLVNAIQAQLLDKVVKEDLESYLTRYSGSILVLLDGYDEVTRTYRDSKSGDINKLLCNRWLHESCVVITTRPNHVSTFKDNSYGCDAHVQLNGLDDDDKLQEYSNKFLMTESFDQSRKLLHHLKRNTNLKEISTIPAICAMLCLLWKQNKTLPTTISKIYREVVLCLATYRLKNYDEERVMKLIAKIGEIALQGLLEDTLVFKAKQFDSDILNDACQLGLVTTTKRLNGLRSVQTVEFLHKTFQEMSAALFLVNLVKSGNYESCLSWLKQIDFIHPENIHQMICFCCGLSDTTTTVKFFLKHIVKSICNRRKELDMLMESSDIRRHIPLHWRAGVSQIFSLNSAAIMLPIEALYEFGNDREDMQEVFYAMTPLFNNYDGCDISYFMMNYVPSQIVYFVHGMVEYNLLQTHVKYLRMDLELYYVNAVKLIEDVVKWLPNVNHLNLTLDGFILFSKMTNWMSNQILHQVGKHIGSLRNLSHYMFRIGDYSPECHKYFYKGLLQTGNAMKIRDYTLRYYHNHIGKSCRAFVSKLQNLQRFQLVNDLFTPIGNVYQVLKSITSPYLEVLDLGGILLDKYSILHIPYIKTLSEFHLTNNYMDRECGLILFDVLRTSSRLLKLTLSQEPVYHDEDQRLLLHDVKTPYLCDEEHVKELCTCLHSLLPLQELSLEGNNIGSNLPLLTNQLKSMPNVSVLNLKDCTMPPNVPFSESVLTEFFRSFADAPALQQVIFSPVMQSQSCESPFLKKCFEELEKDGCTTIVERTRFGLPDDTWRIEPKGIKCIVDTVNNFDN